MKIYLIFLFFLIILPTCSAEIELKPDRVDTYFLYSGMGNVLTSQYIFIGNSTVSNCEMIPDNENILCFIEDDYIAKVWFSTVGESYEGVLEVTDEKGLSNNVPIIIRTHNFGVYSDIPPFHVGAITNSYLLNIFLSTSDGDIVGIRNWLIYWMIFLLLFGIFMYFRK
jgi:hypothetical protein